MMETIILIILAAGIGIFHDTNKPISYALRMEDGSQANIILQKNSQYACPIYCGIDHVHHAIVYDSANQLKNDSKLVYHISKAGENIFAIYCSDKKILSMSKLSPRISREKIPDVISASNEQ